MKRVLLGLTFLLLPSWALANNCVSTGSGLWSAAGTWSSCGGGNPATTDTVSIGSGHRVTLDVDGEGCTTGAGVACLTINGTLVFDFATTGRDGNGFRNFTVTSDGDADNEIAIGASGRLEGGPGSRIQFNTTAGNATSSIAAGAVVRWRGEVYESTIAAITDAAGAGATCNNGGADVGRLYTITLAQNWDKAKTARRVIFTSGAARNRQLEIVAVSGNTISLCTDLLDATTLVVGNESAGQRLTPHASYSGASRTFSSEDSTPAWGNNSDCTGADAPWECCTGAGTGLCIPTTPAVGDSLLIVDDAWMVRSAGTNGWALLFPSTGGSLTPPSFYATNLGGGGYANNAALDYSASTASTACDFSYNNNHDYGGDSVIFRGCQPLTMAWNACHDAGTNVDESSGCTIVLNESVSPTLPTTNVSVTDSIYYRTQGNPLQVSSSGATVAVDGLSVLRNIIHGGCLTNAGECNGIEVDYFHNGRIAYNLVYNMGPGDGSMTFAAIETTGSGSQYVNVSLDHNVVINALGACLGAQPTASNFQGNGIVGNYVSRCKTYGIRGGGGIVAGNVVKEFSIGAGSASPGIDSPVKAYGNAVIVTPGVTSDSRDGIGINTTGNSILTTVDISGNIISLQTGSSNSGGVRWSNSTNFGGTISHNSIDMQKLDGAGFHFLNAAPTVPITISLTDNSVMGCNNQYSIRGSGDAELTLTSDRIYYSSIGTTSDNCAPPNSVTSSTNASALAFGTVWKDRGRGWLQPDGGSPLLAAGGTPAGSDVGVRGFRFNYGAWSNLWRLTFDGALPPSWTNAASVDTDGDGVIDLYDNCDSNWNPSQYDSDADGSGNACDP